MTSEEYRKYIHEMYKENFLDKGTPPKRIQIFGDSFGHFTDGGTWPAELSKNLNCPVISFAFSGANNIRTMSYFHQYYDEDCLNIVLFTSENRTYLSDDIFALTVANSLNYVPLERRLNGYRKDELSSEQFANIVNALGTYFAYIHSSFTAHIFNVMLFEKILLKKNTIVLKCFRDWRPDKGDSRTQPSEKFFDEYNTTLPNLLESVATSLHGLQISQYTKKYADSGHLDGLEIKQQMADYNNVRNHLSYITQKYLGKFISDTLLFNTGSIDFHSLGIPSERELVTNREWSLDRLSKHEDYKKHNIALLKHHYIPIP